MKTSSMLLLVTVLFVHPFAYAKSAVLEAFFNEPKVQLDKYGWGKSYADRLTKYNTLLGLPQAKNLDLFSQSEIHLAKHFYDKQEWQSDDEHIIRMCHEIVDRELEEQKKGRYTLLHAQPWGFQLLEEFYTQLWSKLHNILCNNYIFARFRPIDMPKDILTQHIKIRKSMLAKGRTVSYQKAGEVALCVNYGLFCNNGTQNSFYFFKNNKCRFEPPAHINLAYIFETLNLTPHYKDFENELTALALEHNDLTECGHILLFSMTPQVLEKTVYPTGSSYKMYPLTHIIWNCTGIKELFDSLRNDPWNNAFDHYHFCLLLTGDCGLIPNNGLDVYEFNAVDKEKLEVFEKKKQKLLEKILLNIDFKLAQNPSAQKALSQTVHAKINQWKLFGCLSMENPLLNLS